MKINIYEQVILISLLFVIGWGILVAQSFALARILPSPGWYLLAAFFVGNAAHRVWGLLRLAANLADAQSHGYQIPSSLSTEQWLQIGTSLFTISLGIAGHDFIRRRIRNRLGL